MNKTIYFDHAATTPVRKEVIQAMLPYFDKKYGNASSLHDIGKQSRKAVEEAREVIAKIINAEPEEIIFTSGGTESNNFAVKETAFPNRGKEVITSRIEHDSVLNSCKMLEKLGFKVKYAGVDKEGIVNPKEIEKMINGNTVLVSIMHANNEIGTIQPIEEISKICRQKGVRLHTDAVQTFCKLPIDVKKMGIDLLSASAHKIYGPKGVGFIYIKKGTNISPLLDGGGHEFGLRSGTENVSGIVGFAKAAELASKEMKNENSRLTKLRESFIKELLKIPEARLNGSPTQRLANNVNVSFSKIEGESILLQLNEHGIYVSTGSACSSKSLEPSHVLLSLGLSHLEAHGSLRITLGKSNTEEDIRQLMKVLPGIIENLRKISPLN